MAAPSTLAGWLARLATAAVRPVVLIDGGAGAGKTTLAEQLVIDWPGDITPQLVSLDDLYPGWGGLAAGSAAVPAVITGTGYRRWDWDRSHPGEWRELDPGASLILEGCGSITPASANLADLTIWVELDAAARRARALARDGESFAEHWAEWAEQEAAHWAAHRPKELADVVIRPANT